MDLKEYTDEELQQELQRRVQVREEFENIQLLEDPDFTEVKDICADLIAYIIEEREWPNPSRENDDFPIDLDLMLRTLYGEDVMDKIDAYLEVK